MILVRHYAAQVAVCTKRHHATDHWHVTSSRRYYAYSTGCPSNNMPSLNWFASHCPGRHLSTWQMIAASCLTVLGALYGQRTSRLASYHEHTAAMSTEPLQLLDLVCRTLYRSSYAIQTSLMTILDDRWRDTLMAKHEYGALWPQWRLKKHLVTFLLNKYCHLNDANFIWLHCALIFV